MPTSSVGNSATLPDIGRRARPRRGITLIEMLIVVTLVGMLAAISYPAFSSGLDSVRIGSAADSVAATLNAALTRADRRQDAVEILIDPERRSITTFANPSIPNGRPFVRELVLPDGVAITAVLPRLLNQDDRAPRRFLMFPNGVVPGIAVVLGNQRGNRRIIRIDPISGTPRVERGRAGEGGVLEKE
jgi:general secretion pathway protein H